MYNIDCVLSSEEEGRLWGRKRRWKDRIGVKWEVTTIRADIFKMIHNFLNMENISSTNSSRTFSKTTCHVPVRSVVHAPAGKAFNTIFMLSIAIVALALSAVWCINTFPVDGVICAAISGNTFNIDVATCV